MSAPMVRAILSGAKTQTRRTVTHEHIAEADIFSGAPVTLDGQWEFGVAGEGGVFAHGDFIRCPFGEPGDRLWLRETWGLHAHHDETDWFRGSVRGMREGSIREQFHLALRADWGSMQEGCFWRPGIFMPRWASRITLEIVEVRVQRLQEISEDDARDEGISPSIAHPGLWHNPLPEDERGEDYVTTARDAFGLLWQMINGERAPWASNPWVWALTFRRLV